jgi:hypothetical protein
MVRLSCPSCNSSFTRAELPADRRAACPRCGDVFPVRTWEEVAPAAPEAPAPQPARRERAAWSVRRAVLVALAMGFVGLVAGLGVYYSRGPRPAPGGPDPPPSAGATPPAELVGVGYLPADSAVVFVLQPGPMLAYAERTGQDFRDLGARAGLPNAFFDTLEKLDLAPRRIDHVAGGLSVAEARFTLVLVLRRPFDDEEAFLRGVKATRGNNPEGRYGVELAGLPLTLARVSPTVWVFGFDARKDLEAVDRGGYGAGGRQFARGLAEMIGRVPPNGAAWLATDDQRWDDKPLAAVALRQFGEKPGRAVLEKGRALVAALSFGDPPRLRLFVKAADEAAAGQVRQYFAGRAASDDKVSHGGAGELAFYDTPVDPAAARATLRRLLADAAR